VLVGITSHGYECGLPNYPGIYMDVGYYRDWIAAASSAISQLSNLVVLSAVLFILSVF
jgi:secreted trypsin-like serine protease